MRLLHGALVWAGLFLALPATAQDAAGIVWAKAGPTVALMIRGHGRVHHFQVERALTPAAQEQGLMFRKSMPQGHGMIFPMSPARPATFWMKNTYIPLDILFIGSDHHILKIAANAAPLSEALIPCDDPVAAVLELNGGVAARLGIKAGDQVNW